MYICVSVHLYDIYVGAFHSLARWRAFRIAVYAICNVTMEWQEGEREEGEEEERETEPMRYGNDSSDEFEVV